MKDNDNSVGAAIARIVALTGGAIAGAILANWFDKTLTDRLHEKSQHDKERYARGLAPLSEPDQRERSKSGSPHIIKVEPSQEADEPWKGL